MEKDLNYMRDQIFLKRPVLKEIYEKYGHLFLKDYVSKFSQELKTKPDLDFLAVVEEFARSVYNPVLATQVKEQLNNKPVVSTIDHHGIWNHPVFVNSSVIYSLGFKKDELAIVFSTESISLNNSCWAGCLLYHNEQGELLRKSFFRDKDKTKAVIAAQAISYTDLEKFPEDLENVLDIEPSSNFSKQASKITTNLWSKVFPSAPKLVYLPVESLVNLYLEKVISDPNNFFTKLILTKEGKGLWQKYFGHENTFMFWGLDEKGRRYSLENSGKILEDIPKALAQKNIYPSSPLCFLVLLFSGLTCVGGFNQTTWLTEIKNNFIKLLKEFPQVYSQKVQEIEKLETKFFGEAALAEIKLGPNIIKPSTVDLFLTGKDYYPEFVTKAEAQTLKESLDKAVPEIYSIVFGTK